MLRLIDKQACAYGRSTKGENDWRGRERVCARALRCSREHLATGDSKYGEHLLK
jgi:hypothetical protein